MSINSNNRFSDTWIRVIGIPILALIGVCVNNYEMVVINGHDISYTFKISLPYFILLMFFVAIIWHVNLFIHLKVRKYYERYNDKRKFVKGWLVRLGLYGTTTVFVVLVATGIINYPEHSFNIFIFRFLQSVSFALLFSFLIAGIYETRYFIYEWSKSFTEAEDLKKLNLQIQVDSLRNQINPHFLFNSLNTLSSLVNSDKIKAAKFIDEMSTVYRYVLQNNEKDLITLRDELQFIYSFFDLLKTRYEDAIQLVVFVKETYMDYLLPPHTLQLLVENAVKHNVVSTGRPLTINIFTDELQQLIIENNVQQKITALKSNRMGLANIITKYKLLNQPQVIINHTDVKFQIILPLITTLNGA